MPKTIKTKAEIMRTYRKNHPEDREKQKLIKKKWDEFHKEHNKNYARERQLKNREKYIEDNHNYYEKNKDKVKKRDAQRYINIKSDSQTYKKYISVVYSRKEARKIMAESLGRKLLKGEIVHHLDLNPMNNSLDNLHLFNSREEHTKYHNMLNKIVLELVHNNTKMWTQSEVDNIELMIKDSRDADIKILRENHQLHLDLLRKEYDDIINTFKVSHKDLSEKFELLRASHKKELDEIRKELKERFYKFNKECWEEDKKMDGLRLNNEIDDVFASHGLVEDKNE